MISTIEFCSAFGGANPDLSVEDAGNRTALHMAAYDAHVEVPTLLAHSAACSKPAHIYCCGHMLSLSHSSTQPCCGFVDGHSRLRSFCWKRELMHA